MRSCCIIIRSGACHGPLLMSNYQEQCVACTAPDNGQLSGAVHATHRSCCMISRSGALLGALLENNGGLVTGTAPVVIWVALLQWSFVLVFPTKISSTHI